MSTCTMFSLVILGLCLVTTISQKVGQLSLEYQWKSLDFEWPSDSIKQEFIKNGSFVPESNMASGIKVYNGSVYITVPRLKKGVASTLNVIIEKDGKAILRPFPSWSMQTIGDCSAIQFSQSMEIDPLTGWMWIIDTGIGLMADPTETICPPKLIIYDINRKRIVRTHVFPDHVASRSSFLNDIVLHRVGGKAVLAYISDSGPAHIVTYDFRSDKSFTFADSSMLAESPPSSVVHIGNRSYPETFPINGIAMSPDFRYVYYSSLAGTSLYRIPTTILSNPKGLFKQSVRKVGVKKSQSDGIAFGKKFMYYGALSSNGVYQWDFMKDQNMAAGPDDITLTTQVLVAHDDQRMKWVDTLAFDNEGSLWFTADNAGSFLIEKMNISSPNMFVWKLYLGENGYLGTK
ncbi:major royal jelly protein 1-like [Haliotis rubra]|uniref:major royal jelly protein 1-like n=1 Tax=Haliotis rubra TaxID=36100 RepID=UPI001EE6052A|nr:major royal jelly protein 1-like [Haliotis rubra]